MFCEHTSLILAQHYSCITRHLDIASLMLHYCLITSNIALSLQFPTTEGNLTKRCKFLSLTHRLFIDAKASYLAHTLGHYLLAHIQSRAKEW